MVRGETGTLSPVGAGTDLGFGNPLESIDCVIQTRGLRRITEYNPSDLTIHVEAGTPLAAVHDALAEHNQMLPLETWNGGGATIGGLVATNAQGRLRTMGSVRDWIIGMKVVHADGRATRTGGRVVKNVSGYDLAKLYTGSLGSLAIIVEVSFKVRSRWAATGTARTRLPDRSEAVRLIRAFARSPLEPVSLVWTGPDNEIAVRFGAERAALRWQMDQLPDAPWECFEGDDEDPVWDAVGTMYSRMPEPVVRLAMLPSKLGEVIDRLHPVSWLAHASIGVVLMSLEPDEIPALRREFPAVIQRAPLEVRRRVPTFGFRGTEYELMRRVKTAFDPGRRLNPGRHVDGERET